MTTTRGQRAVLVFMVVFLLLAGLAVAFAVSQHRDAALVRDLQDRGQVATASAAQMRPAAGRGETLRVRARIALPSGTRELELQAVSPNGWSLPKRQWSPAPYPYEGEFLVRFDPDDPARVAAQSDLDGYQGLDLEVLWIMAAVLTAVAAAWVWPTVRAVRAAARHVRSSAAMPQR